MHLSLRQMMFTAVAAAAVAACGSVARADEHGDSISIAFAGEEPPTTPGCQLAPTDVAGAPDFRSANWNNVFGNIGTEGNLVRDKNGHAMESSAVISWTADNTWSTEPGGSRGQFNNCFGGADEALMTGYRDNGNGNATVISVHNLPDEMAKGYLLVIYSLGAGTSQPAAFFVNDPAKAKPKYMVSGGYRTLYKHIYSGPNFVEAIGDDPYLGTTGSTDDFRNYLVFTHLSGDLTIIAQPLPAANGNNRAFVNAIQIFKSGHGD